MLANNINVLYFKLTIFYAWAFLTKAENRRRREDEEKKSLPSCYAGQWRVSKD
jgi:hypothetical protein